MKMQRLRSNLTTKSWVLGLAVGIFFLGCQESEIEVVNRKRTGGTDVTFFVAADTHFGFEGIDAINQRQIAAMNVLNRRPSYRRPYSSVTGVSQRATIHRSMPGN